MKPLIFCSILFLALLAGAAIAQVPQPGDEPIDAHLPLIPQEQSPIHFDVRFWPTHILAGERVNMELTLLNVGTKPFRIPVASPDVYEARINLYLDDPERGPGHHESNVFHTALRPSAERSWDQIREWVTVDPGQSHTVTSNHIFAEAGGMKGAGDYINNLDKARIRTVVRLDDGNFVTSDWVNFTIEQPDPREEDWRGDIVYTGAGDVPSRFGLLKQRVGNKSFWFIASERESRLTHLSRLPIEEIRQVIPPQRVGERMRGVVVLGTDAAGAWHYYGPHLCEESPRGRTVGFLELGKGKTWRLQLTNETDVEIIEVTEEP